MPEVSPTLPGRLSAVERIDQVKVFDLFCFFGGDVKRTADVARCDARIVDALAHDFQWALKIKGQNRLDVPDGLKAEQENNRALNYLMSRKLLEVINGVVLEAATDPDAWAQIHCVETDEDGHKTFSPKPLVEIAKAAQIAQDMTYRALCDKIAATATTSDVNEKGVSNLAINIYAGLEKLAGASARLDRNTEINVTPRVRDLVVDTSIETPVQ